MGWTDEPRKRYVDRMGKERGRQDDRKEGNGTLQKLPVRLIQMRLIWQLIVEALFFSDGT